MLKVGDRVVYRNGRGELVRGIVTRVYPNGRIDAAPSKMTQYEEAVKADEKKDIKSQ